MVRLSYLTQENILNTVH